MIDWDKLISKYNYDVITGAFTNRKGKVLGHVTGAGYRCLSVQGKTISAHRLAWFYVFGEWPKKQIDHINHKKEDNSLKNLRDVSALENSQNKRQYYQIYCPKHRQYKTILV